MPFYANPADSLRNEMSRVTAGLHATVGVSFIHNGRLFTFNDSVHYPMMSVYKVPVALAVLQKMSSTGTSPATRIEVKREQWHPDTYSPMREAFRDSSTQIRLADLLHYCVAMSDNNAADILTAYVGGITVVARTVERLIGKRCIFLKQNRICMKILRMSITTGATRRPWRYCSKKYMKGTRSTAPHAPISND